MRELKFRDFVISDEEDEDSYMISGDSLAFEEYLPLCDLLKDVSGKHNFMQYTGHNDKYGVEIYEKDIVLCPHDKIARVVTWCHEEGCWKIMNAGHLDCKPVYFSTYMDDKNAFRVIGNIYENPELIV